MFCGLQIGVIVDQYALRANFPGTPSQMNDPEIRDHPQQLRSFGYLFYRI